MFYVYIRLARKQNDGDGVHVYHGHCSLHGAADQRVHDRPHVLLCAPTHVHLSADYGSDVSVRQLVLESSLGDVDFLNFLNDRDVIAEVHAEHDDD
jgi:hypothetical protein